MRNQYAAFYGQPRQGGNPYNGNNNYYRRQDITPGDPFSEFGGNDKGPFSEFEEKENDPFEEFNGKDN